jgi:MFS family permease
MLKAAMQERQMSRLPKHAKATLDALRFTGQDTRALEGLTNTDWTGLLTQHEFVRLTLPLLQRCPDKLPPWVRARMANHVADNTERLKRLELTYSEVADAIRVAGAEHIVIKGFAQWPGYTDHPCLHAQSDIDIYCPPESLDTARDAVLSLGYVPDADKRDYFADHTPALVRRTGWHWNGNYFDPEMPPAIELHHSLWNARALHFGPSVESDFWARRIDRSLDRLHFPALSLPDNLAHSSLQLLKDCLLDAMSPVRLYELARFLQFFRDDRQFWQAWECTHSGDLRKLEAIAFLAARDAFGCELSSAASREVRALPDAIAKWFEHFGQTIFDRGMGRPSAGIWLHLTLLDSKKECCKALAAKFLPYRPVSLDVFSQREEVLQGPNRTRDTASTRRRYFEHLRNQAFARATSFIPSVCNGARYWWSTKRLGREYWTFYCASFLFNLGMFVFFLLYNLLLLDRGFNTRFIGLVASASSLGGVAGTILGGLFAHHFGLRKTLLTCFPLLAVICALRVIVTVPSALIDLAFLGGLSAALYAISLSPAVAQMTTDRNRPFGFSVILSSGIAIGILGGLVGGRLPEWLASSHLISTAFAKEGALLVACGLVALAVWPAARLQFATMWRRPPTVYPRSRFLWRFLPAIALWSLVTGGFSPFFNTYFSQRMGMSVDRIGTMFSLSHASQVVAVLCAPFLFRRIGLVKGVMSTQIATAIAIACLAATSGFVGAALVYTLFSAFEWMNEPGIFTLLMDRVSPEERTGASALMFLVISLSQSAAGSLAGAGFVRFGYPAVMFAIAGVAVAAALVFGRLRVDLAPRGQTNAKESVVV